MSKGSSPRRPSVSQDEFAAKFDAIDWNAREQAESEPRCTCTEGNCLVCEEAK
jgi:hypothetical protein